jgi:toxin ParE1/3/4
MVEVTLTDAAWEDLDEIAEFIAKDSPRYADECTTRLLERMGQLAEYPESGRMLPEFANPGIRELIEGNYRIVYSLMEKDVVTVVRVIHSARLFP